MLLNFNGIDDEKQIVTLTGIVVVGTLLLNIFVFHLLSGAVRREIQTRNGCPGMAGTRSEMAMYQQISEDYDQLKKREHEYKNQIEMLSVLVRQGEWEKTMELLETCHHGIDYELDAIDTNHVIVNLILNVKYQQAKEKGIVFVLKVNDLSGIQIKDKDLIVILFNMLNNAIEACEKCVDKRVIKFKAVRENGKVIFSVINTIGEIPHFVNGKYETTKEDRQFHGTGIENIKNMVNQYGGNCVIRHDEKQFYFIIYLSEKY